MKFLFRLIAALLVVFSLIPLITGTSANAQTGNPVSEEEFNQLQQEGVYGDDVDYEMFDEFNSAVLDDSDLPQMLGTQSLEGYTGVTGDILITNDTQASGITGHAGIMVAPGKILEIRGKGHEVTITTLYQWRTRYNKTNVYRVSDYSVASAAAKWARANYFDSNRNPGYQINTSLYSKSPTYCSKIVWQAFYYGTGAKKVMKTPLERMVHPYVLPNLFYSNYKPYVVKKEFFM
ncbi:hypothetical protein CHH58_16040 [Terribacillus saccharophilus]|uniref:YiiX/YebB-like N1pC/P60 family cysteine hydrolase n=1 Tax=Terribacillus saccharophilus TaxID=361277 RepID=UPI000BA7019D|nr:YiiX/YebB-like N1pC/P60 family cysteine hydrolase [Terribacillus saccharophilus]PAF35566.1 hypothetical protein CHH58_16040 [Terribacillus saccharophilus]